jgi:hypothetical protein
MSNTRAITKTPIHFHDKQKRVLMSAARHSNSNKKPTLTKLSFLKSTDAEKVDAKAEGKEKETIQSGNT